MSQKNSAKRVTRSISFELAMIKHCKKRAKKERRSVNWVVNDIIRQDSENALPAAAGVAAR